MKIARLLHITMFFPAAIGLAAVVRSRLTEANFLHILPGALFMINPVLRHEWMTRMFSIGLAIGTIRPIAVLLFIFFRLPPQVFFGTAFWIGFTLHLILAEAWINYSRKSRSVR